MNTFPLQPLCDLIVEAVFPICAIFLLQYGHIRHNAATLSALISGEVHREADIRWGLIAGSMAEGLTMTPQWGASMARHGLDATVRCATEGQHTKGSTSQRDLVITKFVTSMVIEGL